LFWSFILKQQLFTGCDKTDRGGKKVFGSQSSISLIIYLKDVKLQCLMRRIYQRIFRRDFISSAVEHILKISSTRLLVILGIFIIGAALGVSIFERHHSREFDSIFNVIYWLVVTSTTTGYGDIIPTTLFGKALNIAVMSLSLVFMAILTATIASRLVERRLLEGKGMKEVNLRDHVVLCGWNLNAEKVLEAIFRESVERKSEKAVKDVVLINELPEDQITEVLYKFRKFNIKYVRGDFSQETVQKRANIKNARMLVILADGSINSGFIRADERALLAALAARSLNPGLKIAAELVAPDNLSHLSRAGVDTIVLYGAHHDFLLSRAVTAPGLTYAAQNLLNITSGSMFCHAPVPGHLVDHDFREACEYLREKNHGLVIGVISEEERGVSLDDILSEDLSAVDMFIKKQFEGLEDNYFFKGKKVQVHLNPSDKFRLKKDDLLIYIGASGGAQETIRV
jgi:voltage-gated potassium channel